MCKNISARPLRVSDGSQIDDGYGDSVCLDEKLKPFPEMAIQGVGPQGENGRYAQSDESQIDDGHGDSVYLDEKLKLLPGTTSHESCCEKSTLTAAA